MAEVLSLPRKGNLSLKSHLILSYQFQTLFLENFDEK